jgi:hypothetical protein
MNVLSLYCMFTRSANSEKDAFRRDPNSSEVPSTAWLSLVNFRMLIYAMIGIASSIPPNEKRNEAPNQWMVGNGEKDQLHR